MNRLLRTCCILVMAALPALATAGACDTAHSARQTVDGVDAAIAGLKAQQKKKQAELTAQIDAITRKMLDDGHWSKTQTGKIYMEIMQSATYSEMEKKKMATVEVFVDAARAYAGHMKRGDIAAACPQAKAMLFSQEALASFGTRQYTFMRDSAKKAAAYAVKFPEKR